MERSEDDGQTPSPDNVRSFSNSERNEIATSERRTFDTLCRPYVFLLSIGDFLPLNFQVQDTS